MKLLRLILFVCLLPALAHAASPQHAAQAFRFAEKNDWFNAEASARASGYAEVADIMLWMQLRRADQELPFDTYRRFLTRHNNWPDEKIILLRAEHALLRDGLDAATVQSWLGQHPPISGKGKIALAASLLATDARITSLVREAWRGGDFDPSQEQMLLVRYGHMLSGTDHRVRTDRLLWEEKFAAAERMISLIPATDMKLLRARKSLALRAKTANAQLAEVPPSAQSDPGLLFERMRWRDRKGMKAEAEEILLRPMQDPAFAAKWWPYRARYAREAIAQRRYAQAARILASHGKLPDAELADARWLLGWLELRFLKRPQAALPHFANMYNEVSFPVSRSRAAYWAGRAAAAGNQPVEAASWYEKAAAHSTTFYGQTALLELGRSNLPNINHEVTVSPDALRSFEQQPLARTIRTLVNLNQPELANRFFIHRVTLVKDAQEASAVAAFGRSISMVMGVRAAKHALRKNFVLLASGWPRLQVPPGLPVNNEFNHSIMRQESEFDPRAISSAQAMGLMQLLPSTGRHVAKKLGMGFTPTDLYQPQTNITLGSYFLDELLGRMNGSLILTIASYNAGPGNVRKWVASMGNPPADIHGAIDWIERIPFYETRNYVQRVLENMQVYRSINHPGTPLRLRDDMTRSR